ncbi:hypothetical protein SK128_018913, partial [Halocaridina rubra]
NNKSGAVGSNDSFSNIILGDKKEEESIDLHDILFNKGKIEKALQKRSEAAMMKALRKQRAEGTFGEADSKQDKKNYKQEKENCKKEKESFKQEEENCKQEKENCKQEKKKCKQEKEKGKPEKEYGKQEKEKDKQEKEKCQQEKEKCKQEKENCKQEKEKCQQENENCKQKNENCKQEKEKCKKEEKKKPEKEKKKQLCSLKLGVLTHLYMLCDAKMYALTFFLNTLPPFINVSSVFRAKRKYLHEQKFILCLLLSNPIYSPDYDYVYTLKILNKICPLSLIKSQKES